MLKLVLPLPPKVLQPNRARGTHWGTRSRAVKKYRSDAGLAAKALGDCGFPWPRVKVFLAFYFAENRKRDQDNFIAAMKSAFDGLADAGVVENDTDLTPMPPKFFVDKNDPRVELMLVRCDR